VDMSTDCHLSYEPLGKSTPLSSHHCIQPRCPPILYPAESSAFRARAGVEFSPELHLSGDPVLIEDVGLIAQVACDVNNDLPPPINDTESELFTFVSLVPKQVRWAKSTTFSVDNLALISKHLQVLVDWLSDLTVSPPPSLGLDPVAPKLLSSLSHEEVVWLVHRPSSALPPVCPCDWSNGSDTKIHWTSEELHCALGCCWFRTYKHIIQTSLDGQWIDGGEFPVLLGAFTTILKAPRGGAIDREQSIYLNIVHIDIAFVDCVLVGGFRYTLMFIDQATCYNWVFGLKDLLSASILVAFCLFCADAGSYAWCFWCDCDAKLFGTKIWEHHIDNASNIVAMAVGCQLSNGLMELHWKVMVHMARAYLT
jgi:hypothetical protein